MLHWEGGWHGERKIQQVKPLLHIKRSNADWPMITLHQLYQNETIKWLLEQTDVNEKKIQSREMDSVVKVYASKNDANNALNNNLPMSAILAHDGMVHILFWQVGREGATRSSVSLLELKFLDSEGSYVHSMCWMAPLKATEHTTEFATIFELQSEFAKEFILLLPKLHDDGNNFTNYYYCIGHRWTE